MNKIEILEELPNLTPEERYEIRLKLAELDADGWLDVEDLSALRAAKKEEQAAQSVPLDQVMDDLGFSR